MAQSQFFRVAVEGATTDGRVIDRQWIADIAATYNPATFAARVNCEHINGVAPEGPFGSFGDVLAVKAEPVQLSIGGQTVTRLALYAQIKALDSLVALNQAKQKIFTSIEVNPNFAGTGKAYLMGIAVTDNPASLGTEMLQFCGGMGDANPMAARKKNPGNLFTAAEETTIHFAGQSGAIITPAGDTVAITPPAQGDAWDWLRNLLGFRQGGTDAAPPAPRQEPPHQDSGGSRPAQSGGVDHALGAAMFAAMQAERDRYNGQMAAMAQRLDAAEASNTELRTALEGSSPYGFRHRPAATGAENIERADC